MRHYTVVQAARALQAPEGRVWDSLQRLMRYLPDATSGGYITESGLDALRAALDGRANQATS